jgi:hypothetical protein
MRPIFVISIWSNSQLALTVASRIEVLERDMKEGYWMVQRGRWSERQQIYTSHPVWKSVSERYSWCGKTGGATAQRMSDDSRCIKEWFWGQQEGISVTERRSRSKTRRRCGDIINGWLYNFLRYESSLRCCDVRRWDVVVLLGVELVVYKIMGKDSNSISNHKG